MGIMLLFLTLKCKLYPFVPEKVISSSS